MSLIHVNRLTCTPSSSLTKRCRLKTRSDQTRPTSPTRPSRCVGCIVFRRHQHTQSAKNLCQHKCNGIVHWVRFTNTQQKKHRARSINIRDVIITSLATAAAAAVHAQTVQPCIALVWVEGVVAPCFGIERVRKPVSERVSLLGCTCTHFDTDVQFAKTAEHQQKITVAVASMFGLYENVRAKSPLIDDTSNSGGGGLFRFGYHVILIYTIYFAKSENSTRSKKPGGNLMMSVLMLMMM